MSSHSIEYVGCTYHSFHLECKLHFLGVKHASSHLRNSPNFLFSHSILLWSVGNSILPRNTMRNEKWLESFACILSSTTSPDTLNLSYFPLKISILWIFFKWLILGLNGLYPKEARKVINKGEEVLSFLKKMGGHRPTNITTNQCKRLRSSFCP